MRKIPKKVRDCLSNDPFMMRCIYNDVRCDGRVEWEHAWIYAGRQINEVWAIVPVCTFHHRGGGLDKDYNKFVSLLRASDDDLMKYPKKDWGNIKKFLFNKYSKCH